MEEFLTIVSNSYNPPMKQQASKNIYNVIGKTYKLKIQRILCIIHIITNLEEHGKITKNFMHCPHNHTSTNILKFHTNQKQLPKDHDDTTSFPNK